MFFPTLKVVEELVYALMWLLPEITVWEVKRRKQILKIINEALERELLFVSETLLSQRSTQRGFAVCGQRRVP